MRHPYLHDQDVDYMKNKFQKIFDDYLWQTLQKNFAWEKKLLYSITIRCQLGLLVSIFSTISIINYQQVLVVFFQSIYYILLNVKKNCR